MIALYTTINSSELLTFVTFRLPPLPEDICNKVLKNSKTESKTTVDNTRRVHQDAAEILQTVRYGNTAKPQLSRANVLDLYLKC